MCVCVLGVDTKGEKVVGVVPLASHTTALGAPSAPSIIAATSASLISPEVEGPGLGPVVASSDNHWILWWLASVPVEEGGQRVCQRAYMNGPRVQYG